MSSENQVLYCEWKDYSSFTVPDGIDLRDKANVKWYVRWNTLHIETKDGKKYELRATDDPELKTPERCSILEDDSLEQEDIEFNHEFEEKAEDDLWALQDAIYDHTDTKILKAGLDAIRMHKRKEMSDTSLEMYLRLLLKK